MSNCWLKMIGTSVKPWDGQKPYDRNHIGFRGRKPSGIRVGDKMVLYAVGTKRLFALVEVTRACYGSGQTGWPYPAAWLNDLPRPCRNAKEFAMPSITQPLSRRTFLRGVGVTMALPWLESVPVWGDDKPKNASSEPPVRFAALFSGNGFHSKEWW